MLVLIYKEGHTLVDELLGISETLEDAIRMSQVYLAMEEHPECDKVFGDVIIYECTPSIIGKRYIGAVSGETLLFSVDYAIAEIWNTP